ncbi:ATPase [Methylobacterium sp. Leaf102]|uniref:ATP12 family chaperone protein n=1 Tax=Methylobacterium sp. Leaf102 TaxID=1736253 RepID=UPI0006F8B4DE|nr:ATP12 family protein [Methylobacterium sp. Leaf102]KQP24760.1 ATPase [Methylobacterium sp. Leaf102]
MSDDPKSDWLGGADAPPPNPAADPTASARGPGKPALPKRFYAAAGLAEAAAGLAEAEGGLRLTLDGRPAHTPARNPLVLPNRGLAEAVAREWEAQVGVIDPATMPLTRLANTAIDGVAPRRDAVIDDLSAYAGTDLLAYRAGEPDRLVAAQSAAWDPVLDWARENLGARFILGEGVMHVAQPEDTVAALRRAIAATDGPFRLAALHTLTNLTGSLVLALAVLAGHLTPAEAWAAAHVDETYQASVWGTDAEAAARHALRTAEFEAAAHLAALARREPERGSPKT